MAGKVLANDLDGTLFYPKATSRIIPKKNLLFLRKWIAEGNRVVMVSSRSCAFEQRLRKRFDFPFDFIGADGAFADIEGQRVYEKAFDPEKLRSLLFEIERNYSPAMMILTSADYPLLMTKTDNRGLPNFMYMLYQAVQGKYREKRVRNDHVFYREVAQGKCYKIMFTFGVTKKKQRLAEHIASVLAKEYPDFEIAWIKEFIEVTPKGCTKASGLGFYLDYLKVKPENVSVVGDSGNDVPMFHAYPEGSYCMAHSPASVKKEAHAVIKRVSDLEELVLYPSVDSSSNPKKE